jgi:hypothetical protein
LIGHGALPRSHPGRGQDDRTPATEPPLATGGRGLDPQGRNGVEGGFSRCGARANRRAAQDGDGVRTRTWYSRQHPPQEIRE